MNALRDSIKLGCRYIEQPIMGLGRWFSMQLKYAESQLSDTRVEPSTQKINAQMDFCDQVVQGDCLDVLSKVPDNAIDMVLCDLPYGTTQNKWDSVLDLDALWDEYNRVVKPDGAIVLTSQGIFTSHLILSNVENFKYKFVWVKSKATNFLNAKKQPLRKHEDICVFYRKQPTYFPQMTKGEPYDKGVRKAQQSGSYGLFDPVHVATSGDRYPTDVLYFKTAESEGPVFHPTQKPVELGRYLVRTFSRPGDLVLDNTSGSGSFLVAAKMEGRHYFGIELNEHNELHRDQSVDLIAVTERRLADVPFGQALAV